MESERPKIFLSIQEVMKKISAIGKSQRNKQGEGYNFRGIDDVYNELHQHLSEAGVFTVPRTLSRAETTYTSKNGTNMMRVVLQTEYDFYASDGSMITAGPIYSEGNDSSDKASNKALAVAHKYALLQVFCIPTKDEKDPEHQTPENPPAASLRPNSDNKKEFKQAPGCISEKQLNRLFAIRAQVFEKTGFWTQDEVKTFIQTAIGKESSKLLTKTEYDNLIEVIQNKTPETAYN